MLPDSVLAVACFMEGVVGRDEITGRDTTGDGETKDWTGGDTIGWVGTEHKR